jgi:transglutaminase-like putative cysteine protease
MKKKAIFLVSFILALISVASFLFLSHLSHGERIDDEVNQLIQSSPSAEMYPDAGIIYVLDEGIVEVFKDGRRKDTIHLVFKILKDRGKENARIEIGYNSRTETASIIYARTITPEGKIISLNKNAVRVVTPTNYPSDSDHKELTFSMPGVTVGAIMDYKVVIEEKKPTIEGKFSSEFCFQSCDPYAPTYFCRYKVITPEDMHLKHLVLNPLQGLQRFEVSPKITYDEDKKIYKKIYNRKVYKKIYLWEYKNIPQIVEEESMPNMDEVAFRVLVTNMNSWEEVFKWKRENIKGKTRPDEAIKGKVAELTKNLSTTREKTEAIFDYVKREIRYVRCEPQSASEVFKSKYGACVDKSTLLISMLKVAGIPAYYVSIPTHEVGNLIKNFPYPFQFNHSIVAVEKEGGYHFIDPEGKNNRFDYLPDNDRNRDVIIFNDQETLFAKTPLTKPEENTSYTQQKIKIDEEGLIENEVRIFGFGNKEASSCSFFIKYRPTKIKEFLEERVDEISSGAKLLTYIYSDPVNFKESFELNIKYKAQDYCRKAGDILIFDVPEISKECLATGKKDRRNPIVVLDDSYGKDKVEFNVPEGYEVYHIPEPMERKNQYFEFRSSYRQEGEKIFYQREFMRKAIRITPEEYPTYRKFCHEMEKSFNRSVLFQKKNRLTY